MFWKSDEERGRAVIEQFKLPVVQVSGLWVLIFPSGKRWELIQDFYKHPYKPAKSIAVWDTEWQLHAAFGAAIREFSEFMKIIG